MSDPKNPTEETPMTEVPLEQTRDDDEGFQLPPGVEPGKPANPDPSEGQNPPPRRF